jgi:PAS domain-containing protein
VFEQRLPDIQIEFRILHPQRGIRWLLSLGSLTLNEQGDPIRFSGINLDITDRKQSEQKIREQANLLAIATDAIFVHDFDNRILFWNQGAEKLYGWKATDMIDRFCKRSPSKGLGKEKSRKSPRQAKRWWS